MKQRRGMAVETGLSDERHDDQEKEKRRRRTERIITNIFRAMLFCALVSEVYFRSWLNVFSISLILLVTFIPDIISKRANAYFPPEIQLIIVIFLFASIYLGHLNNYYYKFWWWDTMLHFISGVLFGFVGFFLVYAFNSEQRFRITLSPFFLCLFAFCFSVTIGVAWEILEFVLDKILNLNMQRSSLDLNMAQGLMYLRTGVEDTMWDLIADSVGSFIAAIIGYRYLKNNRSSVFINMVHKTFDKNRHLFEKVNED